jgi:hypothetical protein
LLPDYIEETGVDWNVVYDARGHFSEPHTNRTMGCGTIEVGNYLHEMTKPKITPAGFASAGIEIIGPSGNISAVLFCEKEGFNSLFKAVNLADRYDLMIISTKGVSVTAARRLIDSICGDELPLFVLHDFDVAGFMISGTLQRDTRRYQFSNSIKAIDLGMRLDDIEDLEREPAAPTKTNEETLRAQLAENGATDEEIEILLEERVELNAMTSDALVEMIVRKLDEYGLEKVIPGDGLLASAYRAFHRSQQLREKFEEVEKNYDDQKNEIEVPPDLKEQVCWVLEEHEGLRWDQAIQIVLDPTELDQVLEEKQKAARKAGDFTVTNDADDDDVERSARAKRLAAMPVAERDRHIEQLKKSGEGVTPSAVLAASRKEKKGDQEKGVQATTKADDEKTLAMLIEQLGPLANAPLGKSVIAAIAAEDVEDDDDDADEDDDDGGDPGQ